MTHTVADAHLHIFSHGFPGPGGRALLGAEPEVEAYENLRRLHGIVCGLVVGFEADGIDPANNAYIRKLASARSWIATLAYMAADPPPESGAVAAYLDAGHSGIAIYALDETSAAAVTDWPRAVWRVLGDRAAVVSFNARPSAISSLAKFVRREEEVSFLFSHVGLPGRHPTIPSMPEARQRLAPLLVFRC